jgi:FkbM family methyltransferase
MMPLNRYIPPGLFWIYDVQRFAGTRNLQIVFDVGANIGQTACGLIQYLPNAQIFCVEPVAATMQQLKQRYAHQRNIRFVQLAFGSRRERIGIRLHRNSELNTLIQRQSCGSDLTEETETVTIETLDNFCRDNAIDCIDLLKLDVQGWELEVLRGANSLLSRNLIWFVFCEVAFRRQDTMQYFAELNEFMQFSRFDFCGFYDTYRYGSAKQLVGFSNALYVNSNFVRPKPQESALGSPYTNHVSC